MIDPIPLSPSFTQPVQPTQITIHPTEKDEKFLSPYQARKQTAPDIVNDNFLGSFADLIDAVNPLQHIPVVSTLYREMTGDKVSTGARILGGALFGGPVGLLASIIDSIAQDATGNDIGGNIFAAVTGKYEQTAALAKADPKEEEKENPVIL